MGSPLPRAARHPAPHRERSARRAGAHWVRAGRRAHHELARPPRVLRVGGRHRHLRRRRAGDGEHHAGALESRIEPIHSLR